MTWIPDRDSKGGFYIRNAPFKSKEMDGKKLYKRVHGVVKSCSDALTEGIQTNHFEFVIPYDHAKMICNELVLSMITRFYGVEIGDPDNYDLLMTEDLVDSL